MRGFQSRTPVRDIQVLIDARTSSLDHESVPLAQAAGRVLAVTVKAGWPVPPFDRSAMDGYALRGEETFGADLYNPSSFHIIGESLPGRPFPGVVQTGQAVRLMTGSPVPPGANAVARVEATSLRGDFLDVVEPFPPGRHLSRQGEDLPERAIALVAGRRLRPSDLGLLSALGAAHIEVVRRPRVSILITGEELLPPGSPPRNFQIADTNSVMLSALVTRDGGHPQAIGPLADSATLLRKVILEAAARSDVILVSGGSSTGIEDHAPSILAELGELAAHGVALRPASPTGFGWIQQVPTLLLPGNPVSCFCAYDFFGARVVRRLGSLPTQWPYQKLERPLGTKIASVLGRVDYVRVTLQDGRVWPLTASGASLLSTLTAADGFVVIDENSEGLPESAPVQVWLYDSIDC